MIKKPSLCSCREYYRWRQFERDAEKIAARIAARNFKNVFGPARGGLTLAVKLSHLLDIPFAEKPNGPADTLIVDDIADTGKTLRPFSKNGYTIITLFYRKTCAYKPWLRLYEKKEKYIIFPWEKQQCVKNAPRVTAGFMLASDEQKVKQSKEHSLIYLPKTLRSVMKNAQFC